MSNTITLPRAEWEMITVALQLYIDEYSLPGGPISVIIDNINLQLDNQEY